MKKAIFIVKVENFNLKGSCLLSDWLTFQLIDSFLSIFLIHIVLVTMWPFPEKQLCLRMLSEVDCSSLGNCKSFTSFYAMKRKWVLNVKIGGFITCLLPDLPKMQHVAEIPPSWNHPPPSFSAIVSHLPRSVNQNSHFLLNVVSVCSSVISVWKILQQTSSICE